MVESEQSVLMDYLTHRYGELRQRLTRILRNPELANDAMQDTWLRLRKQQMEDRSAIAAGIKSPRAFLMRMATNAAIDILRRHGQTLPHDDIEQLHDLADQEPGPEQVAEARSHLDHLVNSLERLPARQREALVLVRWEGLPQKEVAQRLGVSLRTVEMDIKLAHEYLAARMDEFEE